MSAEQLAIQAIRTLSNSGIPFMVVGSFSSNYWGIPRSTKDVDLVIALPPSETRRLWELFEGQFELDDQLTFETVAGTQKIELRSRETAFTVELFLLSPDTHDQARFQRRTTVELMGCTVPLATAEDVIIQKLRWRRPKDLEDVRDVIAVQQGGLDWSYIRSWCERHGSQENLEKICLSLGISRDH